MKQGNQTVSREECNECYTQLIETKGEYNKNMIYQYCPTCKAGCGMFERIEVIPE